MQKYLYSFFAKSFLKFFNICQPKQISMYKKMYIVHNYFSKKYSCNRKVTGRFIFNSHRSVTIDTVVTFYLFGFLLEIILYKTGTVVINTIKITITNKCCLRSNPKLLMNNFSR